MALEQREYIYLYISISIYKHRKILFKFIEDCLRNKHGHISIEFQTFYDEFSEFKYFLIQATFNYDGASIQQLSAGIHLHLDYISTW